MSDEDDCVVNIAKYLVNSKLQISDLEKYRIFPRDAVYQGVKNTMILICPQEWYKDYDVKRLLASLKVLDQPKQHRFLRNFLIPNPTQQMLDRFAEVCDWFKSLYPLPTDAGISSTFWEAATSEEIAGFERWNRMCKVKRVFGNDVRSQFWAQYVDCMDDVHFVQRTYTGSYLVLYFRTVVVIEFTELGNAAHIIDRELYAKSLAGYFEGVWNATKTELRNMCITNRKDKFIHKPWPDGWQQKAHDVIYAYVKEGLRQ